MSAAYEVLAWNGLAAALMGDFADLSPEQRNLARRGFLSPAPTRSPLYGITDGTEFRQSMVMELRSSFSPPACSEDCGKRFQSARWSR